MTRLLSILTIILTTWGSSIAQTPKKAYPLSNSLQKLWHNGETEKAVNSSIELYQIYPPFFIKRIHDSLSQLIKYDSKSYGKEYLDKLYLKENEKINKIISPIYLWSKVKNTNDKKVLQKAVEELNKMLDSASYESKTERFYLLILQELDRKKAIDAKTKENFLQKNISKLEAYPYLINTKVDRKEGEKRAWHRFLLAYSYNELFTIVPNNEEYLKKASDYSPDLTDRQFSNAYFYDAFLLTDNTKDVSFQTKYQKHLIANNQSSEAIRLTTDIAFGNPSDDNIKLLRNLYEKVDSSVPFNDYWKGYINKMGSPAPKLKIKFEKDELDLTKEPKCWIYIDVWGTWCVPCIEELPKLQTLYSENEKAQNSNLKIYTFSFSSRNLKQFLSKNNYTFPVSEIDIQTKDLFEVSGFPTKILITPEGNYIKIPFGVDWKMYVKNYTLI